MTTQTVADKSDAVKPAEVESAPESLDDILSEFDTGTAEVTAEPAKKPPEEPAKVGTADLGQLTQEVRSLREDAQRRQRQEAAVEAKKAVDECVAKIESQLPEGLSIPKRALAGYLDTYARENPKLVDAFLKRNTNPKAWDKVVSALSDEIGKDFSGASKSDDRSAIVAAVRSASARTASTAPDFDPKKVRSMTAAELYKNFPGLGRR